MDKEGVETVAGRREKERFSLGKNEFLAGIVVQARRARTNGPPPSGPPSGEKVREEEGGRDLGGDFSEKVRERKDPGRGRGEEGHDNPPFPLLPPRFTRLRLFFLPHVRDAPGDTRNEHVHAKRPLSRPRS